MYSLQCLDSFFLPWLPNKRCTSSTGVQSEWASFTVGVKITLTKPPSSSVADEQMDWVEQILYLLSPIVRQVKIFSCILQIFLGFFYFSRFFACLFLLLVYSFFLSAPVILLKRQLCINKIITHILYLNPLNYNIQEPNSSYTIALYAYDLDISRCCLGSIQLSLTQFNCTFI